MDICLEVTLIFDVTAFSNVNKGIQDKGTSIIL